MSILLNTFVFLISLLIIFYLALKFRYFRDKKNTVKKRKFKNVVDVTLAVSVLIFSILHINSFVNAMVRGLEPQSYMRYILLTLALYIVWIFVNVRMHRQGLKGTKTVNTNEFSDS